MIHEYRNYPLRAHNTLGIEAMASHFIEYDAVDDIRLLITQKHIQTPYLHIGGGSNLLFANDYNGTVLHSCIRGIEVTGETKDDVFLKAGAGVIWDEFVQYCVNHEWYGAENLSDIPGEVGASAVQNIGAYGVEAKDIITRVETISVNGVERVFSADECNFSYRHSVFKEPSLKGVFITYVHYKLSKIPVYKLDYGSIREELKKYSCFTLKNIRQAILDIRNVKLPDPKVLGNAGSFFMNPIVPKDIFHHLLTLYPAMPYYEVDAERVKIPAGWLIEQCGWKGKSLGNVRMYEKQALVLVNNGGASGAEVIALCEAVRNSVREKFNIEIKPEVKILT